MPVSIVSISFSRSISRMQTHVFLLSLSTFDVFSGDAITSEERHRVEHATTASFGEKAKFEQLSSET